MRTVEQLLVKMDAGWYTTIDDERRWLLVRSRPYYPDLDPIEVRYTLEWWMCGRPTDDRELRNEPQGLIARISDRDAHSIMKAASEGLQAIVAGADSFGPIGWTSLRGGEGVAVTVQNKFDATIVLAFGNGAAAMPIAFDTTGIDCLREALAIAERAFSQDLVSQRA